MVLPTEAITNLKKIFHNEEGYNDNDEGWIITKNIDKWNYASWAERQKNMSVFIHEEIEAILKILKSNSFISA